MKRFALALCACLLTGLAQAATVTVTISQNAVDIDWTSATIADLPGPDGEISLAEAFIATNHSAGRDTIAFAIPQSNWGMQWLYPGRAVLESSVSGFHRAQDAVTVDGRTQTAFTGDTYADGWELVIYSGSLSLGAADCEVFGFDNTDVNVDGANCLVEGLSGPATDISLFSGGGSTMRDNEGGTIKIDRSDANVVVGNRMSRVRVWLADGNVIGGPDAQDRTFLRGYGTINSEGLPAGSTVELFEVTNTLIENNWIGTEDGLTQGNLASTMGIDFSGVCAGVTVRDNLISGILGHGTGPHHAGQLFGYGIFMEGTLSDITLVGNTLGLDINGQPTLGAVRGIDIGNSAYSSFAQVTIGGPDAGQGNAIAGHYFDGIVVGRTVQGVTIRGNSIHDNGWLAIDLIANDFSTGVTPNDVLDADQGGNGLQNFPVITTAAHAAGGVQVSGTLHGAPQEDFDLDFFASPDCDDSGYGQGFLYLGSKAVSTNGAGDASFDAFVPGTVEEGWVITATATRTALGQTSEFSACAAVEGLVTAVEPVDAAPRARLGLPWPNPANPHVTVDLAMAQEGPVRLRVLDAAGRLVATLHDGVAPAGDMRLSWDGRDARGHAAASGLYFFDLTGSASATRKFTLLR
ncbi:MAG: hypothetical protein H6694_06635 [Candidatus Latescibacteria bacterium]|nr:hypothetical protein [Candidatus Latescibacterota bacterium]